MLQRKRNVNNYVIEKKGMLIIMLQRKMLWGKMLIIMLQRKKEC